MIIFRRHGRPVGRKGTAGRSITLTAGVCLERGLSRRRCRRLRPDAPTIPRSCWYISLRRRRWPETIPLAVCPGKTIPPCRRSARFRFHNKSRSPLRHWSKQTCPFRLRISGSRHRRIASSRPAAKWRCTRSKGFCSSCCCRVCGVPNRETTSPNRTAVSNPKPEPAVKPPESLPRNDSTTLCGRRSAPFLRALDKERARA
jgi:hypothetical protein